VRRDADPFARSNHLPGGLGRQILLAHVNPSGIHRGSDIGAVVYQKREALGNQLGAEPAGRFEKFARRRALVPVLEQADSGIGELLGAICFRNGNQCCV
jgi:hypothetical protein